MLGSIFIGLGSNLGDRSHHLSDARDQLTLRAGRILNESSIYETAPMGFEALQNFHNQVVEIESELGPLDLLNTLLEIERRLGRERSEKPGYSSRNIDLDLLFYKHQVIDEPHLNLPHPGVPFRRFVIDPLAEIASDFIHPVLQKTIWEIKQDCSDDSPIRKLK